MNASVWPARVGWLLLVLTMAGSAVRLGVWQLDRAAQKESLQALIDARSSQPLLEGSSFATACCAEPAVLHYRPVRLRGRWIDEHSVFLENRQMKGRPGFFMVTPLRIEGRDEAVLVQRGWAARDADDRTRLPTVPTVAGEIVVEGLIAPPPARLYEFSAAASGPIRQNIDLAAFAAETGLALLPISVLQRDSPAGNRDPLLREWPRPAVDIHKHYGYAFQWFALGALMTGLYVWFQLVRPWLRRRRRRC